MPAREALQLLRVQGLAIHQPRRGRRVAPLDPASIQEIIDIRAALETLALKLAAPRITAMHLGKIERALAAGDKARTIVEWEPGVSSSTHRAVQDAEIAEHARRSATCKRAHHRFRSSRR